MGFKDKEYEVLRQKLIQKFGESEINILDEAYELAAKAHMPQLRRSGQPYIIHPVAVAEILLDLSADIESIQAALLHDVVEDTDISLDTLKQKFGDTVALLVDGVTKLGKVPLADREEEQAENLRKMLMAMSQDIRVIIIKLADRLHNMRTLEFVREEKRRFTAKETLEFYAPIAHRLGIRSVKEELEDLAISYLDPIGYKEISDSLSAQSDSRNEFLETIKKRVSERIKEFIPNARIEGRIKSVHGIYRKMYIQNRNFDEIYDVYAVRIIVDTVNDCYNCLGLIHDMFRPIPGRFKDYISTPKPNLYQSLHSTLIGKEGIPFEVQIRTWEMHETAEYGIAAHWKYKLGHASDSDMDKQLSWIRRFLENQESTEDALDILRSIKNELVPDDVYVFTPKGDVISLPQGANIIDFAYAIHSEVGNRMIGAKVDGRIVQFDHLVKTGEIIEILTTGSQSKGPSRDWIKMVKTSEARSKIRMWFKREKRDENIVVGKSEFERELRRTNLNPDNEIVRELIIKASDKQNFNDVNDFYAAIGYGGLLLSRIVPHIRDEYNKIVKASPLSVEIKEAKQTSSEGIIVPNIDNCLVKLSRCCGPIPGDEIIGYITRGHGVSVHKRDCSNVPKIIEDSQEPERWIEVLWDYSVRENFNATLLLKCTDENKDLMGDIYSAIANMRLELHAFDYRENKGKGAKGSTLTVNITVNSVEHLWSIIARFEKVKGVISVERTGI